jgi:hypothetical protein
LGRERKVKWVKSQITVLHEREGTANGDSCECKVHQGHMGRGEEAFGSIAQRSQKLGQSDGALIG